MALDFGIVKRHPAASAGVVLATVVVVYFATRKQNAPATQASSTGVTALSSTAVGTDAVASQYNAQIQVAAYQAQVASEQTSAALTAQESNNQTALDIARVTTQGTTRQVAIGAQSATDIASLNAESATEIAANNAAAATEIATVNANAAMNIEATKASVLTTAGAETSDLVQRLIAGHYTGAGIAKVVSATQGQGPQALAATQPSDVAGSPSAILNAVTKPITGLLSTLFG